MKVSHRRKVKKAGPDFYPTPDWGTEALLRYEYFHGHILEPCCGDGAMSEVLKKHGHSVFSSDLYNRGYGNQHDFFDVKNRYDNIVTNPPFNIAEEVFHHAWELANNKVALLLRTAFLESKRRWENIFSKNPPYRVLVFTERLSMYPKGAIVTGGGTTSYSWFIWDKDDESDDTIINWIRPGMKPKKEL